MAGWVYTTESDRETWDLWVVKTDENGVEQWNHTFNGQHDSFDYGSQILETPDTGFLVSGCTGTVNDWAIDYLLLKLDKNGAEIWNKTYHRFSSDQSSSLVLLKDSNYLIGGLSRQTTDSSSQHEIWILKVDENGTRIWEDGVVFGNATEPMASWENCLIGTLDGGFLLACYPWAGNVNMGEDYRIIKCDSNGDTEWDKTIGSVDSDTPWVCLQSPTGDFYIGGSYESSSGSIPKGDFCLMKLSNTGELLWKQVDGDFLYGESIVDMELVDGGTSNESIVACGFQLIPGSNLHFNSWIGWYDTVEPTTTTTKVNSNLGLIMPSLGILILIKKRKKRI